MAFGAKLSNAISSASEAAKQKASAIMSEGLALAKKGASAVVSGVTAVLESDMAYKAVIAASGLLPGGGIISTILKGVKAGYDYALKGEKDYVSADPYLDKSLKETAMTHCGGNLQAAKARRRRERESMIAAGKASGDKQKVAAAERLERDMAGVERARLSKHVYDANDPEKWVGEPPAPPDPPVGFLKPTPEELEKFGIEQADLQPKGSSFRAQVYKVDPLVGPIPPDFIVAFRGTTEWADSKEGNIPQAVGRSSDLYNRAMALADSMGKGTPPSAVEFTGHSLGGGMASAASVVSGYPATTQNSAGLHDNTTKMYGTALDRKKAESQVNAYRIDDAEKKEILSSLNSLPLVPDAIGTPRKLRAPKAGVSRLGLHGVDVVIDSIEDNKTEDQQTLAPR